MVSLTNENRGTCRKILQVKLVYYGPAMSGKTTSIKYLFSYFNKGEKLKSIDSSVGRTLFFDCYGAPELMNLGARLRAFHFTNGRRIALLRPAVVYLKSDAAASGLQFLPYQA